MKKIFWTLTLILFLNIPAGAEEIVPHLTVYGTATIEVTPDEMYWTLKVSNRGAHVEELARQHSNIVLSAISFIDDAGVLEENTQTAMMQFGENWIHQNGRRVQEGYFASSQISFKLIDFTQYQHLWIGLSKIKDMSIQNIGYGYSKHIEVQDKARLDALLAARKKADAMAKTLNVGLKDPLVIEENQEFAETRRSNMLMAREAGLGSGSNDTGGVALGKILIKSSVKVVYQIGVPE